MRPNVKGVIAYEVEKLGNKADGLGFYPKAKPAATVTTDLLCQALANKTSVHKLDVKTVLMALYDKIAEKALEGYQVDVGGFLYFYPAIRTEPGQIKENCTDYKAYNAGVGVVRSIAIRGKINQRWRELPQSVLKRKISEGTKKWLREEFIVFLYDNMADDGSTITSAAMIGRQMDMQDPLLAIDVNASSTSQLLYDELGVTFPDGWDSEAIRTVGDAIDYLEKHV